MGEAIVRAAKEKNLTLSDAVRFNARPGHGIQATLGGRDILLGNLRHMKTAGIDTSAIAALRLESLAAEGKRPC